MLTWSPRDAASAFSSSCGTRQVRSASGVWPQPSSGTPWASSSCSTWLITTPSFVQGWNMERVFFIYSIFDSFIRDWLDQLTTHAYTSTPDIVLCGNKVDLENCRSVTSEKAQVCCLQIIGWVFANKFSLIRKWLKSLDFHILKHQQLQERAWKMQLMASCPWLWQELSAA